MLVEHRDGEVDKQTLSLSSKIVHDNQPKTFLKDICALQPMIGHETKCGKLYLPTNGRYEF